MLRPYASRIRIAVGVYIGCLTRLHGGMLRLFFNDCNSINFVILICVDSLNWRANASEAGTISVKTTSPHHGL